MIKKSFTLNPQGTCIFGSFAQPKSVCVFDYWSIHHFYITGVIYIILHHTLDISTLESAILLNVLITILHTTEEYLGNTTRLSFEGIVIDYISPLIDPKIKPELRGIDNDYLQNSIGDVVSGIICCSFIIWYWNKYNTLPYFYLYGSFLIFIMLLQQSKQLYDPSTSSNF